MDDRDQRKGLRRKLMVEQMAEAALRREHRHSASKDEEGRSSRKNLQRQKTQEISTLDLIEEKRRLLKMIDIRTDKELRRLRRNLLQAQKRVKALEAEKAHLIRLLRSAHTGKRTLRKENQKMREKSKTNENEGKNEGKNEDERISRVSASCALGLGGGGARVPIS